jgi:hypothetical protein
MGVGGRGRAGEACHLIIVIGEILRKELALRFLIWGTKGFFFRADQPSQNTYLDTAK